MDNKRVSTRLSNQDYLFVSAMARTNNQSVSTYLKDKLFEPKCKMSNEQAKQILQEFTKRVDILTLTRIDQDVLLY